MKFISSHIILQLNNEIITRFGGCHGSVKHNLLESAIARAKHAYHYGEKNIFILAAHYAYGIANNHPFTDANKRTAYATSLAFLKINGIKHIKSDDGSQVDNLLALTEKRITIKTFAKFLATQVQT